MVSTRQGPLLPNPHPPVVPAARPLPNHCLISWRHAAKSEVGTRVTVGREEVSFPSCAVLFLCYNTKHWLAVCKIPINIPKHYAPDPTAPAARFQLEKKSLSALPLGGNCHIITLTSWHSNRLQHLVESGNESLCQPETEDELGTGHQELGSKTLEERTQALVLGHVGDDAET